MICRYQDPGQPPCKETAELVPVMELRSDWTSPVLFCIVGKLGTCHGHASTVSLVSVIINVDFESIAAMFEKNGHKRPQMKFTTMGWKPVPPDFDPNLPPPDMTPIQRQAIKKPGLILPN